MNSHAKSPDPPFRHGEWLDRFGMGASFLCLLHCLALPLVIAALPSLSQILQVPEAFHVWVVLFAVPCSLWALLAGRARHGAVMPLLIGCAGLLFLIAGVTFLHDAGWETPATVAGSLLLSAAHVLNLRWSHKREPGQAC